MGENPYLTAPRAIPDDPFAPFNDWARITTPYGPVWTNIARVMYAATGDDPVWAALGFKLLAGVAALGLAWVTILLARRLTGDRALALGAGVLVAWQPALLLESAGTGHLDATMMSLALGGLLLLATERRGSFRGGLLLLAASALVKPVTLPLLGLAALGRLWSPESLAGVARRWLLDVAAILGFAAAMFAPYWSGGELAGELLGQSKLLYVDDPFNVNAFWFWVLPELPGVPGGERWEELTDWTVRPATQVVTLLLLLGSLVWLLRCAVAWRHAPTAPPGDRRLPTVVRAWAIVAATLALLPVNAHAWYALWAVAPIALVWALGVRRGGRMWPWWLWVYLVWSAVSFLIYHTAVWPGE